MVVVVDGSTDGTITMLNGLGDPRVKTIVHERSRGQAAARNAGIRAARGRWVAFLDDDDLWAPWKLRQQVTAGDANGAVLVYCGAVGFFDNGETVVADRPVPRPAALPEMILRSNPLPGGASAQLARKDTLDALGGFAEEFELLTDWDMWIRLTEVGAAAAVEERLVGYRFHESNISSRDADANLSEFDRFVARHTPAAQRRGVSIDGIGFSHWQAAGQRRAGRRWSAARLHLRAAVKYGDLGHLGCALRAPFAGTLGLRPSQAQEEHSEAPAWLRGMRAVPTAE